MSIFCLTSGPFLAGFASFMGASDQFNGIIGGIPSLAAIAQIFSPMIFEKFKKKKFLLSVLAFFYRIILGLLIFIPIILIKSNERLLVLAFFYFFAYIISAIITPSASNWIVSLTPNEIRGRYFGKRDAVIISSNIIFTLGLGKILDIFRSYGNEYSGFSIVYATVVLLAIANFLLLSNIPEPRLITNKTAVNLKSIITIPIKNKSFRKVIYLFIFWNIGLQLAGPFFAVYMVTGLKLDYAYIMLISLIASLIRIVMSVVWGKLADKKTWVFTTVASIGLLGVCHFLWSFVTLANYHVLYPLSAIIGGIAWGGIGISLFNIQFMFAPEQGRSVYLGFNAALSGIIGFISTLIGALIIGSIGHNKLIVLGLGFGNMQMVFALSGVIIITCAIITNIMFKNHDELIQIAPTL
ncbi:MAG TPA: MFS transporter [Ruminiclostridium sp.]